MFALAHLAVALPLLTVGMPDIDLDAACRDHYKTDPRGATYCGNLEEEAKTYAEAVWDDTLPKTQAYCERVGWGNGIQGYGENGKVTYDHSQARFGFYQRLGNCLLTMRQTDYYQRTR